MAGQPSPNVIAGLARLFVEAVVPKGQQMKRPMSFLAYWPDEWATHVPAILACRPPIADTRLCYGMDATGPEILESLSRLILPPGRCDLRPVDGGLLGSAGIRNIGEVRSEILKQWNSLDDFLTKGAGYCLVDRHANHGKGAVTSWALSEYPAGDECSIGVETVEEYRRKGHGTVVSAACISRCVEMGYRPVWDLWLSNKPSKALAEKLGLKLKATYPVFFFWYNEVDNLLVNGNVAFSTRDRPAEDASRYSALATVSPATAPSKPRSP